MMHNEQYDSNKDKDLKADIVVIGYDAQRKQAIAAF
jgi:hypothetical protein